MEPPGSRRAVALTLALASVLAVACGPRPALGDIEQGTPIAPPADGSTDSGTAVDAGSVPATGGSPAASPVVVVPAADDTPDVAPPPSPSRTAIPTPVPTPRPVPTPDLASIEDLIDAITEALADDAATPTDEGRP